MVRDLALYLKDHASPMVMIDSVDDLHEFNLQLGFENAYGQAELIAELDIDPAELETLVTASERRSGCNGSPVRRQ